MSPGGAGVPAHPEGWRPGPPDFVGVGAARPGHVVGRPHRRAPGTSRVRRPRRSTTSTALRARARRGRHRRLPRLLRATGRQPAPASGRRATCWTPGHRALLRRAAPDARLLVLLRDPVERFRRATDEPLARRRLTVGSDPAPRPPTRRSAAALYADQLCACGGPSRASRCSSSSTSAASRTRWQQLRATFAFLGLDPGAAGGHRRRVRGQRAARARRRALTVAGGRRSLAATRRRTAAGGARARTWTSRSGRCPRERAASAPRRLLVRGLARLASVAGPTAPAARPPPPECPAGWRIGPPDFVGVGPRRRAPRGGTRSSPRIPTSTGSRPAQGAPLLRPSWEAAVQRRRTARATRRYFPRPRGRDAGEWTPGYLIDFWTPEPHRPRCARGAGPHPAARPARAVPLRPDPPAGDARRAACRIATSRAPSSAASTRRSCGACSAAFPRRARARRASTRPAARTRPGSWRGTYAFLGLRAVRSRRGRAACERQPDDRAQVRAVGGAAGGAARRLGARPGAAARPRPGPGPLPVAERARGRPGLIPDAPTSPARGATPADRAKEAATLAASRGRGGSAAPARE